jgi:hypothetical protein
VKHILRPSLTFAVSTLSTTHHVRKATRLTISLGVRSYGPRVVFPSVLLMMFLGTGSSHMGSSRCSFMLCAYGMQWHFPPNFNFNFNMLVRQLVSDNASNSTVKSSDER